jgi:hypothetical protein
MEVNSFNQSAMSGRRPRRFAWMLIPALLAIAALAGMGNVPRADAQATGTVSVQKRLVDANGMTVTGDLSGFVFTLSGSGTTITLPATNAQGQTSIGVAAGNYSITEQPRAGATLVGFTAQGAPNVPIGSFTVTAGQTVNLVATNQVSGNSVISITKTIVDAAGATVANADRSGFQFAITGPGGFAATLTTDANGAATAGNLGAGTYTVTEQPRSGFVLASLTINGVPVTNGASFTLAAGQTAAIAAANRQGTATGSVSIIKQIVDQSGNAVSGDRSGFQFSITCGSAAALTGTTDANGAATIANVPAGNCTVSEATRQGFTLVSIFVGTATADIGNGGTFAVTAGQTTTLTVRNRSGGTTGQTEQIQLFSGCNNVTVTWPNGTATGTVVQGIQPASILIAIWRFDNAAQRFVGFSPIPNAPNDLVTVDRAQPVFICTNGGGSLTRPVI